MKERRELADGTIINPVYGDFDPLATKPPGEPTQLLYRFRTLGPPHLRVELRKLMTGSDIFAAKVASLNDPLEARPRFAKQRKISDEEEKELGRCVIRAILDSKEGSRLYADPIWNSNGNELYSRPEFFPMLSNEFRAIYSGILRNDNESYLAAIRWLRNSLRVACFTTNAQNASMWGTYGASFSGICLELNDSFRYRSGSPYLPYDVTYDERRPLLDSLDILYLLMFARVVQNWTLSDLSISATDNRFLAVLRKFCFTKRVDWKHECEVRAVAFRSSSGYVNLPGLTLNRILIGENTPVAEVITLVKECGLTVPVVRMGFCDEADELVELEIISGHV